MWTLSIRPVRARDCADLLDGLAEGPPRHRAVDLIERNRWTGRVIVADPRAGVGINQTLAQARNDVARRLRRDVSGAAEFAERALPHGIDKPL